MIHNVSKEPAPSFSLRFFMRFRKETLFIRARPFMFLEKRFVFGGIPNLSEPFRNCNVDGNPLNHLASPLLTGHAHAASLVRNAGTITEQH